jgi:hypothetical protein
MQSYQVAPQLVTSSSPPLEPITYANLPSAAPLSEWDGTVRKIVTPKTV